MESTTPEHHTASTSPAAADSPSPRFSHHESPINQSQSVLRSPPLSPLNLHPRSASPPPKPPSPDASSISSGHSSVSSLSDDNLRRDPPETPPPATKRLVQEEPKVVTGVDRGAEDRFVSAGEVGDGDGVNGGGSSRDEGRRRRPELRKLRKAKRRNWGKRLLVGFRVWGFVFCLVSFSMMAADKNQGWALDSFHRYKEFRYSITVNIIGCAYSGLQAADIAYQLATGGGPIGGNHIRCYADFFLDQILAYLLMSSSSSAATRVEDWESNWGKDKFPSMAKTSVVLSFVAFFAVALSSLGSGYILCTLRSSTT